MADRPRHVVDFHTHAFPEKVAERAVSALTELYHLDPVATPTIPGLIAHMDAAGVDVSVVLPVATRPDQVVSINDWAAVSSSERIVCFGALHPDLPDPTAEIDRMVGLGLKGLKFQPQFQHFSPDEERMWPIYEALEGRLVVVFHSGEDIMAIPHIYARPATLTRVHRRFPRLTMVAAHLGGYRTWEEAREHVIGEDLYVETSYCPEGELPDAAFQAMVEAHGTDRVLFGTDFPWGDARTDVARLCRVDLTQEQVEAVAWKNASALLGLGLE